MKDTFRRMLTLTVSQDWTNSFKVANPRAKIHLTISAYLTSSVSPNVSPPFLTRSYHFTHSRHAFRVAASGSGLYQKRTVRSTSETKLFSKNVLSSWRAIDVPQTYEQNGSHHLYHVNI